MLRFLVFALNSLCTHVDCYSAALSCCLTFDRSAFYWCFNMLMFGTEVCLFAVRRLFSPRLISWH